MGGGRDDVLELTLCYSRTLKLQVDAEELRVLRPGEAHSWELPITGPHAEFDCIEVSTLRHVQVTGESDVPLVEDFAGSFDF